MYLKKKMIWNSQNNFLKRRKLKGLTLTSRLYYTATIIKGQVVQALGLKIYERKEYSRNKLTQIQSDNF